MIDETKLLEKLQSMLSWKKSKERYAEILGVDVDTVDSLLQKIRGEKDSQLVIEFDEESKRINREKGTMESVVITTFEPKNDGELAALHKVDLTKYKISSYWTKQRGDKFTSSLLCTLIKPEEFNEAKFEEFLSSYKSSYKPIATKQFKAIGEFVDVEISLLDVHLDKLVTSLEDVEERKTQYLQILSNLLYNTTLYNVDKIAFILGNDLFHTDNWQGGTTSGTPMEINTSWFNAYEQGFDLMVRAITDVKMYCKNVEVILVQGNHARTKEYYLAHALEAYFKKDESITFNRSEKNLKYTVLGNTFVGYHHGNTKIDELPLVFATEPSFSYDFALCPYREIHTGDKHHYTSKEIKGSGVRVMQLPALCANDRWHVDGNFVHQIRAGLAMVYSPTRGKIAEFEERIKSND